MGKSSISNNLKKYNISDNFKINGNRLYTYHISDNFKIYGNRLKFFIKNC